MAVESVEKHVWASEDLCTCKRGPEIEHVPRDSRWGPRNAGTKQRWQNVNTVPAHLQWHPRAEFLAIARECRLQLLFATSDCTIVAIYKHSYCRCIELDRGLDVHEDSSECDADVHVKRACDL